MIAGAFCSDPRAGRELAGALSASSRGGFYASGPAWLCPGPDSQAFFVDREAGAALVFSGELYNGAELRRELESAGCRLRTALESELVLRAYLRWGAACQQKFNGEWAFAAWEERSGRLFCSRDRFGLQSFYYHAGRGSFIFSSSLHALLACPGVPREPDDGPVFDYLVLNNNCQPEETFFRGVKKLRAGHYLLLKRPGTVPAPALYYDPPCDPGLGVHDKKTLRRHAAEFRGLLEDAVRVRLAPPHPLGAMLSGGMDSSSLVCLSARLLRGEKEKLATVSIAWSHEAEFIEESSVKAGFRAYRIAPEAVNGVSWDEVQRAALAAEKPVNDSSVIGEIQLLKTARRKGLEVLLDGSGGDELLAGYPNKYFNVYLNQVLKSRGLAAFNAEFKAMFAERLEEFNIFGEPPKDFYKLFLRTQRSSGELSELFPAETLDGDFLREQARRRPPLRRLPEFNLQEVLRRETLGLGAELEHIIPFRFRMPLLDHRVVDHALSLPACYKVRAGWTKYLLREAMRGVLPEKVRCRKEKIGGTTPASAWKGFLLRNSGKLREALSGRNFRSARYVNRAGVLKNFDRLLAAGTAPGASDISALWRFANLEMWLGENLAARGSGRAAKKSANRSRSRTGISR